jgi:hypothetical protein
MIAADPGQGGAAWAVLQYVLGLRRLGHDVLFVEPLRPDALRPAGSAFPASLNAAYFSRVTSEFDLGEASALLLADTRETVGLPYGQLLRRARRTDVLINISGMLADQDMIGSIPVRVYLDLDPAFNQLWSAVEGIDMRFAAHTHHVTIGLALGTPECPVPTCGVSWIETLQPVVLDHWPVATSIEFDAFTTIGNWRGYGSIEFNGVPYGQKVHSMRRFMTLPTLTAEKFILAMGIHPDEEKDLAALSANGWRLLDPAAVADTPARYRAFIQGSRAEFGVAKSGYAVSRCGWFSDRSVCYLASGRPVIAQETGFSRFLPTGEGLFAFENTEDILRAIAALRADYPRHARRARAIAEEHFDSDRVLSGLLRTLGC